MVLGFSHDRNAARAAMQRLPDFQQYTRLVLTPLTIPEAEFFDALSCQKLRAFRVQLRLFRQTVLKSIEFNGQLGGGTIEVEVVVVQGLLAAKFEAGKATGFQRLPELPFFIGLLSAQ